MLNNEIQKNVSNNSNSDDKNKSFFVAVTYIEGILVGINLFAMLCVAFKVNIKIPILEIIPSFLIMLQVPLMPLLLFALFFSIVFLFMHRNVDYKQSAAGTRKLINMHIIYVLYFVIMFVYFGVIGMSLPQPK
jgi:hypothetical protein